MQPIDPAGEISRLYLEIAKLEVELRTASLRNPEVVADYSHRLRALRDEVQRHQKPLQRRSQT